MFDAPDSIELIAAVRNFLHDEVAPTLEGRRLFHARVAVNVLDIVRREMEAGPQIAAQEHGRLRTILGAEGTVEDLNRILCQRLRARELSLDSPGVREHLWETTLAKVAVDQPKYSGYRAALRERK